MDAHLVDEAVGVEEGNALTPQHRDQEDDAGMIMMALACR